MTVETWLSFSVVVVMSNPFPRSNATWPGFSFCQHKRWKWSESIHESSSKMSTVYICFWWTRDRCQRPYLDSLLPWSTSGVGGQSSSRIWKLELWNFASDSVESPDCHRFYKRNTSTMPHPGSLYPTKNKNRHWTAEWHGFAARLHFYGRHSKYGNR